jgi:DNA-binding transcriptional ArsR family regulator
MVNHSHVALDATFGALSDATRRGILAQLALGETSVSDLAAPYDMSLPAVSKHLRVLADAGLIQRHKDGRVHRCRLAPEPMKGAAEWIAYYRQFWERQFDALDQYLAQSQAPAQEKEKQSWQTPRQATAAPVSRSKSSARSRRRAKKSGRRGPNAKA